MKAKITKNFENVKVKLNAIEAKDLWIELENINTNNENMFKTKYPKLYRLLKLFEKLTP